MEHVSYFIAFSAGLLSALSPCTLPIFPGFLSYILSLSSSQKISQKRPISFLRAEILLHSLLFVFGFFITFIVLALLLNSTLSLIAFAFKMWLSYIGGLIVIFFGLFTIGIVRIPFLEHEYKLPQVSTPWRYLTSILFGITFSLGWSPCVGAILGSILTLAAINSNGALLLLIAYSAGMSVPFLLIGALGSGALGILHRFRFIMPYFNYISGILLILLGILILTGQLSSIGFFFFK